MTSLLVRNVSPGTTGWWKRHSAYPRLATALSETSGTVLPKATWKAISSSTGCCCEADRRLANSALLGSANRVG